MYLIINKTKNKKIKCVGNFPSNMLEEWLNEGDKIIVISTYSNTIKVPYFVYSNGETAWEYEDFPLDINVLNQYKNG